MGTVPILQSPAEWADAVAALPAHGALPLRTVLVPSERHAHALRRRLVRDGRSRVLAGTRFVGALTLAREVLAAAGRSFRTGEEALRPARLTALFAEDLGLEHFDRSLARRTPGWAEAIAAALGDLEAGGLSPDRLPGSTGHWRDLALLWRRLDAAAGDSLTAARTYALATDALRRGIRPETGPVLAAATGRETLVQAAFVRELPDATVAILAARPLRDRHLDRVEALFGTEARNALASAPAPSASATERDLLAGHLFASPERLAEDGRPRSAGPDGTVHLEEHAGTDAEIEAAAEWVAREVVERRTPLSEVAILFPVRDPMASLVAARLGRLPWTGGPFPVHVAGGLPAVSLAGGARALALVRALGAFLPAELVSDLLPALRAPIGKREHLSREEAMGLAWSLGTVGGSAARPEGALEWRPRAEARAAQLEAELARIEKDGALEDREGRACRAALDEVAAARPAIDALVGVAHLLVEGRPFSEMASAVLGFLEDWLLDPGAPPVGALLAGSLQGARADAVGRAVGGADALALIEERLLSLRVSTLRFGEPAVYVGTLAGAAGLEFQAVRVLGLCEGSLPSAAREDAILPDRMRAEAERSLLVAADRSLAQLHAVDLAVRGAGRAVCLSAPRSDLERSEREPSSLLVEAGAALWRPDPLCPGPIPDLASLGRTSFGPARDGAAAFRDAHPVTATQWLDRAASKGEVPPAFASGGPVDVGRVLALRRRERLGPADGLIGPAEPFPRLPGLHPDRPISASALQDLLACPLRFLYGRVLRWEEPAEAPPLRELDALTYGSLFHEVMEEFYRRHGEAFVERKGSLSRWRKVADGIADEVFRRNLASYPLVGRGIAEKERARLDHDLARFLEYDWKRPLKRLVGVEVPFATDLDAGGRPLHVQGRVDRIDVEGDHTLVRDLKTGTAYPRDPDEPPDPVRDVQIGLYALVARKLAASWKVPHRLEAAYAYARRGIERAFRGDYALLEASTRDWLSFAARALSERAFPPTPDKGDCAYCPFAPVCGPSATARSVAEAEAGDASGALAEFFRLKGVGE